MLWGLEETTVVAFLFVLMWGAVRPGEILPVTLLFGGGLVLCVVHVTRRS